mgnify:CR=1 FL=1|tara:strand:- start:534 stop:734 length:201 start_codon:yes stop_codon:yes gene_type:complete
MYREINKLIKDVGIENTSVYNKLVSIASKVVKRKKYLLIDVLDMESAVDGSRATKASGVDRVEVTL